MDTRTIQEIQKTTEELLDKLMVSASVMVEVDESKIVKVKISPLSEAASLGTLIGYHGETLLALQLILSLIVNRDREEWLRLTVDVDEYRVKREQSLNELAKRTMEKARFLNEPVPLYPMPAADRRIIHLAVEEVPDLESESVGEGRQRRVVIKPKVTTKGEVV